MNKKFVAYIIVPAVVLSFFGIGVASAHGWFGFGNVTPEEIATRQESIFEHKADILGLGVDQIKDFWAEGKTFQEIIEESGLSNEEIKDRMRELKQARLEERLQVLIDQGVISQSQADLRLESINERIEAGSFGEKKFHGGYRHSF